MSPPIQGDNDHQSPRWRRRLTTVSGGKRQHCLIYSFFLEASGRLFTVILMVVKIAAVSVSSLWATLAVAFLLLFPGTSTTTNTLVRAREMAETVSSACEGVEPGDIHLIVLNSESPDQLAFFTLDSVPPAVGEIYVTDRPWNGTHLLDNGEGTVAVSQVFSSCSCFQLLALFG